ncbi:MAG: NAD-dependent epimerase/dehydratase family protein [Hyphomicrobiaceae bacterium]
MPTKRVLITGGAGFIGCNAALYFANRNWRVTVLDNLSRAGTDQNLAWLVETAEFDFARADVRDAAAIEDIFRQQSFDAVIHLAAQVAVTTSVTDPRDDFMINALGTFNVLDAVRRHCPHSVFIFASTNKVYGKIGDATTELTGTRYRYTNRPFGIDEAEPLDFLSPYGCSKGAADQYTLDYARIYGIPAAAFRQSCIYGPRQFGIEDQGWVAWFAIAALVGRDITIFGDGKQVRDVLHVEDLVRAYEAAILAPDRIAGQAFNIGGGPRRVMSLIDLIEMLQRRLGRKIPLKWADWRPGDQRVYISDIRKVERTLDWTPSIDVERGIERLLDWVGDNRHAFEAASETPPPASDRPRHSEPA